MIKKDVTEILKFITQLENGENLQKLSYSESEEYLNPIIDKLNLIVDKRNKKYHSFSELILNIVTDNCEEQNLINQKKSFQNLLDVLDKIVLISITDLSGNIIFANDKFCEVSGYLREELLGKNHRIVKSDYHTPEFYKNFWTTISGGLVWHGEICNQKKDRNNYWVDSVITAMRDENNNIIQYLSVGFVVTTCKKLEHYTQQSSKLVLLGEMASGIAHEIKNPLFFISGTLSQLPKLLSEPDKFNLKVDKLKQACERITRFTNGLTKYSRKKDKKNYQQCFLSSIIEETFLLIFEKIREHEVTITFDNKSESPILCDEIEIEQVFVNLIINAIDAVKNLEKRWIKISLLDETSFIVCRIIDSGSGISEEIRQ